MTAIRGYVPATDPPGLGVHSLDHFVLAVPDLAPAQRFYSDFGLDVRPPATRSGSRPPAMTSAGAWWWRASARSCTISRSAATRTTCPICRSARKRTASSSSTRPRVSRATASGFAIRPACSSRSRSRPRCRRHTRRPGPGRRRRKAWRARRCGPRRRSCVRAGCHTCSCSPPTWIARWRSTRTSSACASPTVPTASPSCTPSTAATITSWRSRNRPGPGLHHCSWDMSGIDDIGLGAMHMAGKGYSEGWGLGRHVLGSNYFHYVRDPWGSYAEYSCDIDYIPAEQSWQAGSHPPEELLLPVGSRAAGRLRAQPRALGRVHGWNRCAREETETLP